MVSVGQISMRTERLTFRAVSHKMQAKKNCKGVTKMMRIS